MRKLIVVVVLLIPFLLGCEPEKEEFYGVRFEQNGYQFELPPSDVTFMTGPVKYVLINYPLTDSSLIGSGGYAAILHIVQDEPGTYDLTSWEVSFTQVPYYNKPPCASDFIEEHGVINLTINKWDEIEASFEYSQTFHNICDTNSTYTNTITNGYIHKKNY
jgi:hypothetical protein